MGARSTSSNSGFSYGTTGVYTGSVSSPHKQYPNRYGGQQNNYGNNNGARRWQ